MKFLGQTFKNIHDVLSVLLEMTLCVFVCFIEFYMFLLDEINMRVPLVI